MICLNFRRLIWWHEKNSSFVLMLTVIWRRKNCNAAWMLTAFSTVPPVEFISICLFLVGPHQRFQIFRLKQLVKHRQTKFNRSFPSVIIDFSCVDCICIVHRISPKQIIENTVFIWWLLMSHDLINLLYASEARWDSAMYRQILTVYDGGNGQLIENFHSGLVALLVVTN